MFLIFTHSCVKDEEPADTISDSDGNVYTYVTIGTQVWMAENLKTTLYSDGTLIPNVTDEYEWDNLSTPAYCWYDNDEVNKAVYGALYNLHAVNTGKLCPEGWHVPADKEWEVLETFLGGGSVAGGKMKEIGTNHWQNPNKEATNNGGFKALPGGYRGDPNNDFWMLGIMGCWWSSTQSGTFGVSRYVESCNRYLTTHDFKHYTGLSIRCLKD